MSYNSIRINGVISNQKFQPFGFVNTEGLSGWKIQVKDLFTPKFSRIQYICHIYYVHLTPLPESGGSIRLLDYQSIRRAVKYSHNYQLLRKNSRLPHQHLLFLAQSISFRFSTMLLIAGMCTVASFSLCFQLGHKNRDKHVINILNQKDGMRVFKKGQVKKKLLLAEVGWVN